MVKPVTTALVAVAAAVVVVPVLDLTVYPVIGLPPLDAGADQCTVADALPAVAVTEVGAPGAVAGFDAVTDAALTCAEIRAADSALL